MSLRWSTKAQAALAYFFSPLQDIDLYIEDSQDEVFYTELMKRIVPKEVRLVRVFSAGDRLSVVDRARTHDFAGRRALFLIDGDFEWVRDEPPPDVAGVYRLPAYCIENLLIDEDAGVQVIIEEAALPEGEARAALAFGEWMDEISGPLVGLFVSLALLNAVKPDERTVGLGIGSVIASRRRKLPELDRRKVEVVRRAIDDKTAAVVGMEVAAVLRDKVSRRVGSLPLAIDIVSGKHFLMPLFEYRLRKSINGAVRRVSLRIRLARHCNRKRFKTLTAAVVAAARGDLR